MLQNKHLFKVILPLYLCLLIFAPLADSADEGKSGLKKVSFATLWLPQAQFAGYYMAKEKGFYTRHGLDVEIINGGPDNPPLTLLEKDGADFVILWLSTAIEKRSQGHDIVNIAQILQRSGLMLVAKKSSGIIMPSDMNGKKVGLWASDFEIQPHSFFKKYNLNVTIVEQSYSVNLFLSGGVDVASAMWYNEYHTIINSGYDPEELTTFFFYDHGLNAPEDGIYTTEKFYNTAPAACRAFVKASIEGWIYAFNHVDEAVKAVLKHMSDAHVPATYLHQKWQLERMKDLTLINGDYKGIGKLNPSDYANVALSLKDNGIIKETPPMTALYKDCVSNDKN